MVVFRDGDGDDHSHRTLYVCNMYVFTKNNKIIDYIQMLTVLFVT